jgi:hypothetical protein
MATGLAKLTEEREEAMRAQQYLKAQKEQFVQQERFRELRQGHQEFQQREMEARERMRSRSFGSVRVSGVQDALEWPSMLPVPTEVQQIWDMVNEITQRAFMQPMFMRPRGEFEPLEPVRPGSVFSFGAEGAGTATNASNALQPPKSEFERDLVARAARVKEPDRDAIPRVSLGESPRLGPRGDDALAIKAEKLLGYKVLREARRLPGQLRQALQNLEIEPLDLAAVEQYKTEMAAFRQLDIDKRTGRDNVKFFRQNNTRIIAGREAIILATWRRVSMQSYSEAGKQIPEFALRKAVAIAEEVPDVIFQVDELVEKEYVVDPFLWAFHGNERFVIEVWGENKFERAL